MFRKLTVGFDRMSAIMVSRLMISIQTPHAIFISGNFSITNSGSHAVDAMMHNIELDLQEE